MNKMPCYRREGDPSLAWSLDPQSSSGYRSESGSKYRSGSVSGLESLRDPSLCRSLGQSQGQCLDPNPDRSQTHGLGLRFWIWTQTLTRRHGTFCAIAEPLDLILPHSEMPDPLLSVYLQCFSWVSRTVSGLYKTVSLIPNCSGPQLVEEANLGLHEKWYLHLGQLVLHCLHFRSLRSVIMCYVMLKC